MADMAAEPQQNVTPSRLFKLSGSRISCMYLRICARWSSLLYPTDISRECAMMVWQMAYYFSWLIQLVIFVSWKVMKLSGCLEIYSHQSEIVTECTATINYFKYWLLTGIEINMVRIRSRLRFLEETNTSHSVLYIMFTILKVLNRKLFFNNEKSNSLLNFN